MKTSEIVHMSPEELLSGHKQVRLIRGEEMKNFIEKLNLFERDPDFSFLIEIDGIVLIPTRDTEINGPGYLYFANGPDLLMITG